ncbi:hypothetical protein TRFO_04580 [Tritrichomonas foetus]|uniref:Uncharacterized protein n=1 Tax=Tritrichomonas foetus TaxID=1144522 RepID=A0A1J4KEX6_9EUKA|nr:hypothetical protein TRFO_04580 [Tritrichomonas foetus]|eukprot:OHT09488.1 hypothetical protein TRFO_04580 [Tritrichomonas foetus]
MKKTPNLTNKKTEPADNASSSSKSRASHSERDYISIENFNQGSKKVYFTEPATIEAIRRLGYTCGDLNCKSLLEFKRPGCDDSVTSLLYNKYEAKRQRIIKEITETRSQILDEEEKAAMEKLNSNSQFDQNNNKTDLGGTSPFVRIEKAFLEKEKENFLNIQKQREIDLRRIVVSQFRDFFQHQKNEESLQKTLYKTEQIAQLKTQIIMTARSKACQPPKESPQAVTLPPMKPMYVDVHLERVKKLREEEAKKREEIRIRNEEHIKVTHERSIELQEQKKEEHLKKINDDENRFIKWKENQEQIIQKKREKFLLRQQYEKNVFQNGIKIEEDMKNRSLAKINQSDIRSKTQTETFKSSLHSRLENIRNRVNERSIKAQEELQRQKNELEIYRKKLDDRDSEIVEKRKKQSLDTTLKYLSRSLDRDEKAENAKRLGIRKAYMAEMNMKKRYDDTATTQQLLAEKQKVINGKHLLDSKFQAQKEQLLYEFRTAKDPNDPKCKKKIAELLQISEDELEKLVQVAKSTVGEFARPQTALASIRSRANSRASERAASSTK